MLLGSLHEVSGLNDASWIKLNLGAPHECILKLCEAPLFVSHTMLKGGETAFPDFCCSTLHEKSSITVACHILLSIKDLNLRFRA